MTDFPTEYPVNYLSFLASNYRKGGMIPVITGHKIGSNYEVHLFCIFSYSNCI